MKIWDFYDSKASVVFASAVAACHNPYCDNKFLDSTYLWQGTSQ